MKFDTAKLSLLYNSKVQHILHNTRKNIKIEMFPFIYFGKPLKGTRLKRVGCVHNNYSFISPWQQHTTSNRH